LPASFRRRRWISSSRAPPDPPGTGQRPSAAWWRTSVAAVQQASYASLPRRGGAHRQCFAGTDGSGGSRPCHGRVSRIRDARRDMPLWPARPRVPPEPGGPGTVSRRPCTGAALNASRRVASDCAPDGSARPAPPRRSPPPRRQMSLRRLHAVAGPAAGAHDIAPPLTNRDHSHTGPPGGPTMAVLSLTWTCRSTGPSPPVVPPDQPVPADEAWGQKGYLQGDRELPLVVSTTAAVSAMKDAGHATGCQGWPERAA
jgi:hypothetical protein